MNQQPPDISDLMLRIIERLDLEPDDVRAITFDATKPYVAVTSYRRNNNGHKYLHHGEVAAITTKHDIRLNSSRSPGSIRTHGMNQV